MWIVFFVFLLLEKNGIVDYVSYFCNVLQGFGIEVVMLFVGVVVDSVNIVSWLDSVDWNGFDLVYVEFGGGCLGEFIVLCELCKCFLCLLLSVMVYDLECMVWCCECLFWLLNLLECLFFFLFQVVVVFVDLLILCEECVVVQGLMCLVIFIGLGGECLVWWMCLLFGWVEVINYGNLEIVMVLLLLLDILCLLYFGFIYCGKGIEDLFEVFVDLFVSVLEMCQCVCLILVGGIVVEMVFGVGGNYFDQLKVQIVEFGLVDVIDWNLNLVVVDILCIIQVYYVMVLLYCELKKFGLFGQQCGISGVLFWVVVCGCGVIILDVCVFVEEVVSGNGVIYFQGDVVVFFEQLLNFVCEFCLVQVWVECVGVIGYVWIWLCIVLCFQVLFNDMVGIVYGM